jgi:hypothetical protein
MWLERPCTLYLYDCPPCVHQSNALRWAKSTSTGPGPNGMSSPSGNAELGRESSTLLGVRFTPPGDSFDRGVSRSSFSRETIELESSLCLEKEKRGIMMMVFQVQVQSSS